MSRLVIYLSLSIAVHLLAVFPLLAEQFSPVVEHSAAAGVRSEPVVLTVPKIRMQTAALKQVVRESALEKSVERVAELSNVKPQVRTKPMPTIAVEQPKLKPAPKSKTVAQPAPPRASESAATRSDAQIESQSQGALPTPELEAAVAASAVAHTNAQSATAKSSAQTQSAPTEVLSRQPRFARAPAPPVYPAQAKRRQQQGTVWVEVRLNAQGRQLALQVLHSSGVPSLDQAALAAVRKWQFLPEQHNGVGVPSRVHIPIEFAIAAHR